ncbi:hypothetical protein AB0F81_36115 [Actinoplanes sp. NPDC024001]|uniref:hypothetical protein n=1 Tax=Actinoplanes sp. NPDC024001 TaxID=3154598 RepID=UPI0033D36A80
MPRLRPAIGRLLIPAVAATMLLITGCSGSPSPATEPAAAAAAASASAAPSGTASTPPSPTPSAAVSASPPPPKNRIDLVCSPDEETTATTAFTVPAGAKGRYDFRAVWKAAQYDCAVSAVNGVPQVAVAPTTSLQKTAMKTAEYDDPDISSLFELCAQASPDDLYLSGAFTMSEAQITELTGALTLCPSHPFAGKWRKAMKKGERENGAGDSDDAVQGVHPGAFCSPVGARGYTSAGTLMKCSYKAGDSRARWRRA